MKVECVRVGRCAQSICDGGNSNFAVVKYLRDLDSESSENGKRRVGLTGVITSVYRAFELMRY